MSVCVNRVCVCMRVWITANTCVCKFLPSYFLRLWISLFSDNLHLKICYLIKVMFIWLGPPLRVVYYFCLSAFTVIFLEHNGTREKYAKQGKQLRDVTLNHRPDTAAGALAMIVQADQSLPWSWSVCLWQQPSCVHGIEFCPVHIMCRLHAYYPWTVMVDATSMTLSWYTSLVRKSPPTALMYKLKIK